MNINATLFAQSLNFFIAYWVLRILIFKPAVQVITQQAHQHAQQQHMINEVTQQIEVCKKEQADIWNAAHLAFEQSKPEQKKLREQVFRDLTPALHPVEISQKNQETVSADLTHALVDRFKRC